MHASPKALAPLGNIIVDNLLIQSRPHARPHSFHLWPPNSSDLNPVDHKVWSVMQEQVIHTPIHNVNYLKQHFLDVHMWATVGQRIIYCFVNLNFGR